MIWARSGEHRRPRGTGGTQPGRSSCVRNVGTPSGSGPFGSGKPTARRAQLLGGNRMTEKRTPVAERQRETGTSMAGPSSRPSRITGRIPGLVPGRESVLTRSGEPVKRKMTEAPEPKDKLDADGRLRGERTRGRDPGLGRRLIGVRVEESVRRLRQRIFTASRAGDLARVRSLQKLMLRSRANTLLSVRRVTRAQRRSSDGGRGRRGGAHPRGQGELGRQGCSATIEPFKALPVRRVYIPKKGSSAKRRPLGIPVILDRCHQARVASALEPEWEARFEPKSYGFRPGPRLP